ncbi:MAG TPA: response regulator [Opitutaceae bacterium]|nr:response regulator [Opitutaceae bacterium]HND61202.1 response regulator [Opitutaceae bacterium]
MSRARQVLVIDDDVAVRLRLGDLLHEAGGYVLHEAADGPAGLAAAFTQQPDLILLDIMMPGMNGYEVCAQLRADPRTREIPVIVLSAAEESEALVSAIDAGADDFLRKPFYSPELRAKVRTIMRLDRFRTLAGERDRFRWLVDHSLEPVIVADGRGAVVYANQGARQIFGLTGEEGEDVATAVGRHFRAEPADAWAAWRELRLPGGASFAIVQPETELVEARWFEVELHAIEAPSDQTLLKFTDRTREVRHALETFAFQHLIAHKIRTPLNGLRPILDFLAEDRESGDTAGSQELLDVARTSARRLEETLTGILDYHAAAFSLRATAADAAPRSLAQIVDSAAEGADLVGHVRLEAPAGTVAHGETLEIALSEIFENYAKFSSAKEQHATARLTGTADRWSLAVFAPGVWLPADVLAELGRPFGQLEKTFTGEVPGIGLGLATVRLLLRSFGGDLSLANHPDQPGIITTLLLPLDAFQPSSDHARDPHVL